jgi:hypothetical protein
MWNIGVSYLFRATCDVTLCVMYFKIIFLNQESANYFYEL